MKNLKAWQISYRTNDSHDQPELAVTTLLVPATPWRGPGKRPVVSVQYAEDSTGTQCAPSYLIVSPVGGAITSLFAGAYLAKGWAVAMPDFEGPKSVFMGGFQAGHAVLDGIRAVKRSKLARIGAANPWAMNGYSGGSQATGWAAQLQPSYAPELRLLGAAMGGTPADPAAVARFLDGGPFSGFEAAATASFDAEYPEAGIGKVVNAAGAKVLRESRGKCLTELAASFAFKKLADYSIVPDPLNVPSIARVLKLNTLGATAPTIPIFNYHAEGDEIVPVGQDNTLVRTWCRKGATLQTVRDKGGEHGLEMVARQKDTVKFLAARFAGKRPTDTC
jgi:hypothetical protein